LHRFLSCTRNILNDCGSPAKYLETNRLAAAAGSLIVDRTGGFQSGPKPCLVFHSNFHKKADLFELTHSILRERFESG
jgi:hypothetical protein